MLVSGRVELYRMFDMQVAHVRDVALCGFVWLMKGKMETEQLILLHKRASDL